MWKAGSNVIQSWPAVFLAAGFCKHGLAPFVPLRSHLSSTRLLFRPSRSYASIMTQPQSQYRLPLDLKPVHYDIVIKTDLENLTFEGQANIHLHVNKPTSQITFNAFDLKLGDVTVIAEGVQNGSPLKAESVEMLGKSERASAKFSTTLPENSKVQLGVRFGSKLTGSMLGYYFSKYKVNGVEKHYTLTQFEPTAARRAFPCWDEPLLKATYAITMISRSDTVNLSNMPVASEEPYDGSVSHKNFAELFDSALAGGDASSPASGQWKVTKFDTTPLVSTYLVAFANGPFEYLESSYKSPLSGKVRPLRVYATADLIHQAQWGLDVKASVLPIYEKVFDVEFPLPKLDTLVAHDFDSGAMENWGLITGRTSAYLLDPQNENFAAKKRIANVQAHEVAHQWFGNIVTMAWWDNLWLNEGFATLMGEMIVLDKVYPEWNLYEEFIGAHLNDALRLDSKLSSHPIQVPIDNPDDINQIFDALTYAKAGSVLRMLSEFVGEEKFLKGVSIYLKKRLYGNSVETDLWDGISEATGLDIPSVINNWVLKIGYPVVTVEETGSGLTLRQDRFLDSGKPEAKDNETIWQIPLFLTTKDASGKVSMDRNGILGQREMSINLDTSKPFLVKGGNRGVYRVLYSQERIKKIAEEASKPDSIVSLEDRVGLMNDAIALAKASLGKTSDALNLIKGFHWEQKFLGCEEMSIGCATVASIHWEESAIVEGMYAFRKSLFTPHVERLGYEKRPNDTPNDIELRTLAVGEAEVTGDETVVKELRRRFKAFVETKDQSHIPSDLILPVYYSAVRYGSAKEWEEVVEVFRNPATPAHKIAAMRALCASKDLELIKRTITFITTDVQDQDTYYFYSGLGGNRYARRALAEHTMENWDAILKRYELSYTMLQAIVKSVFTRLSTEEDAVKVEEFFKGKDTSKFTMALEQTLETMRTSAKWVKASKSDVKQWVQENGFATAASSL